jgi:hypothetical protein
VLVEEQIVVTEMNAAPVPMKILCLHEVQRRRRAGDAE